MVTSTAPRLPAPVEIAHLSFLPPFAPGSYNRSIGRFLDYAPELQQVAVCYWDRPLPAGTGDARVLLAGRMGLPLRRQAYLHLPERLRSRWARGIGSREFLAYSWQVLQLLPRLRPRVVLCYDGYKLGPLLRRVIKWPCRLILYQHGLSYFLPPAAASQLYSLQSFDAVIVLTRASYALERQRISSYEPLVKVLPNGVDVERFKPVSSTERQAAQAGWQLPADRQVVLALGRLVPKKGIHLLLCAWPAIVAAVPQALLWIVGSGEPGYVAYLRQLITTLDIGASVRLQGSVPAEQTPLCYQSADLFVFPSLCGEGMSLALLEAMACGLPCVVSDQPAARELDAEHALTLVSDPNLDAAFVEPLIGLLRDGALRASRGAAARQAMQERYSQACAFAALRGFLQQQLRLVEARP